MIKAVIFDLDGTLCNTTDVIEDALRGIFTKYTSKFPNKSVGDLVSINIKTFENLIADPNVPLSAAIIRVWFEVFEQLKMKPSLKIILQLIEHVRYEVNKRVRLNDGILELINYLKSKGIKIGVLTNGIFIDQANKLVKLKLDGLVDYLVTSDMCAVDKPDPRIFKYLLDKMSVSPKQALMIGDNITQDIKGAHAVGLTTIYLKNNRTLDVNRKTAEADYIKTNHKDILKLVKKLTSNQKIDIDW